jgi:hypothetical protein
MLSDRSTFTSSNARATDLFYCFFLGGVVVIKEVLSLALIGVLAAAGDVLTRSSSSIKIEANAAAAARVCLKELKLSPPLSLLWTLVAAVLGSFEVWQDSSNDRV